MLALAAAPTALATQRFASPTGTGTECTQMAPCSLNEAVGAAKAGNEVILTPGTYSPSSPAFAPAVTNVQIHGEPGGPMPRVVTAFAGAVFGLTQAGDSLSYVEIESDANGGAGFFCVGAHIERVKVKVVGAGGEGAILYQDCLIRNSLFRVEGGGSVGLLAAGSGTVSSSAAARNVTAIVSGSNSRGATAEYNEAAPGSFTLELENSILQGSEADLKPVAGAKGPGNILATHDNFDSAVPVGEAKVVDGGGNQSAAPLFVDSENGDYREAAGSPTIDAGLAGELGPLDLGGSSRALGAAPDIGAFEATPSPAEPGGGVRSISIKPKRFTKKAKVTFTMSGPATVEFSVSKRIGHSTKYKPLKGVFTKQGETGRNSFSFNGRIGGKKLKPGAYKLSAFAGHLVSAAFEIAAPAKHRRHRG
jgi:hypothetical protein